MKKYIAKLKKKVKIDKVMVYGSVLTKKFNPERSDVDVIVLSPNFTPKKAEEVQSLLYRESVGFPFDLHIYGMTREEFENPLRYSSLSVINKKARSLETLNFQ